MTASEPDRTRLSLATLVGLLDIELLDRDLFRATNPWPTTHRILFGGLVAAQAMRAAANTVEPQRLPHSLHGYFLRPGQIDRPTILRVERDRDGRSFSTRRVAALQDGDVIFDTTISFHVNDEGQKFDSDVAPETGPPDTLPATRPGGAFHYAADVFEFRLASEEYPPEVSGSRAVPTRFWLRTRATLGDDPLLHACLLTYASDLSTGFGDLRWPIHPPSGGPSLDHAVWFHRPLRVDEWFLVDHTPVVADAGRGLYHGMIYDSTGRRTTTIAQEILIRHPR